MGKGTRVGILGLGGLGHMGVKLAAAMGAEVTMLSHTPSKEKDAKRLGAHKFVLTSDEAQVKSVMGYFDFILDTVSADHDYNFYLGLLRTSGVMVCVGAPSAPATVPAFNLIFGRKSIAGSLIGGLPHSSADCRKRRRCWTSVPSIISYLILNSSVWTRSMKRMNDC